MAISAYTGLQGSGKSHGAVENVIIPALKSGRRIFTNVPMVEEECLAQFGRVPDQFDIDDIVRNPNWWSDVFPAGAILVLDEAWRLWPGGLPMSKARDQDKEFLAEHRHLVGEDGYSTEVYILVQDLSNLASFARNLVATTYRHVKLESIGKTKRFRVDIYEGPASGPNPPAKNRRSEVYGKYSPKVWCLYKSHTKSLTGDAGLEVRTDRRFSVFTSLPVQIGASFAVVLVVALGYFSNKLRNTDKSHRDTRTAAITETSNSRNPLEDTIVEHKRGAELYKRSSFRFLSVADSFTIIFNSGRAPNIDYRFMVKINDTETKLSVKDLKKLQYSIVPINNCMVKIQGPDFDGFALCESAEEKKGWVEGLVATSGVD